MDKLKNNTIANFIKKLNSYNSEGLLKSITLNFENCYIITIDAKDIEFFDFNIRNESYNDLTKLNFSLNKKKNGFHSKKYEDHFENYINLSSFTLQINEKKLKKTDVDFILNNKNITSITLTYNEKEKLVKPRDEETERRNKEIKQKLENKELNIHYFIENYPEDIVEKYLDYEDRNNVNFTLYPPYTHKEGVMFNQFSDYQISFLTLSSLGLKWALNLTKDKKKNKNKPSDEKFLTIFANEKYLNNDVTLLGNKDLLKELEKGGFLFFESITYFLENKEAEIFYANKNKEFKW